MTIARFLLAGSIVAVTIGPVGAQFDNSNPLLRDLGLPVHPVNAIGPPLELPPFVPPSQPTAAVANSDAAPVPPVVVTSDPLGTLTGKPTQSLPPGSYPSPYYVDGPGCCGPLGRDGRIGYELYSYVSLSLPFGDGLPTRLEPGWGAGGGLRTLLFDASHTAAYTVDFGGSYTYNRGQGTRDAADIFLRSPPQQNQFNGAFTVVPDRLVFTAIRGVHRSSFNFAFGRDVWLRGDGSTGGQTCTNVRVGGWLGGRYGTSHVDLVPLDEINGYSRRQNVFHGIYVGTHATVDVPMGAWIWTSGMRIEYGHDWTNLTPPLQGNIHSANIQWTTGIRY